MVDSRDFYGRSFMTPSVQNPVINPISPPSGHMQWNHPNHHPQPFNTDYQIPRYPPYSNIRKVSNGGPWIPGRHCPPDTDVLKGRFKCLDIFKL